MFYYPLCRTKYWTKNSFSDNCTIWTAGMDGTDPHVAVSGLKLPYGIAIDLNMSRLYWTEEDMDRIQSANLDGSDTRTIVKLSGPQGIAVLADEIFWGNWRSHELQSSSKTGGHIRTLHTHARNGVNLCESQNCSKLCVLSPSSFRCLDWLVARWRRHKNCTRIVSPVIKQNLIPLQSSGDQGMLLQLYASVQ